MNDDLFSVSFPTQTDGWVCGRWGTVQSTHDGGLSWEHQNTKTDYTLSDIFFIDSLEGWAVGDAGTIIHTSDGGKTWTAQKSPVPYFLMGLFFVNSREGWIATERTTILHTVDGGKTWTVQFSDEDFILKSISFCDEQNGWSVGEYGYTYHTANGGKTWEKQAGEFGMSEETGEIIGGNYLFDVVAIDPNTAWVSGIDGYVARTTDGGATWQRVAQGVPRAHLFGIASGIRGKVITGGTATLGLAYENSFQAARLSPSIKYSWIYGISSRGLAGFAAVGSEGRIYVSDSQAALWKQAIGGAGLQH